MKYLVVDDSPTMRRIVINAMAAIGFSNIVEAQDGQDALEKLQENEIDFIITDWNMPVMSGIDFVKAVKGNDNFKNIPVVMVTTRGEKSDIITALQAKVDNYIVKPFTPSTLKTKLDAVKEKYGMK